MTVNRHLLLNCMLALYAIITLARAVSNVAQPYGAGDLYVYWYAGHFLREGRNPYLAYLNDEAPNTPVQYLDGATFNTLPKPWIVPFSPLTNTAPYVLLTAMLSLFNWYLAKWAFFLINLALALSIPALTLRVLKLDWLFANRLTLHLLFFATIGNRTTLVNSQNSLMFVGIMLLVLDAFVLHSKPQRPVLSKYQWAVAILLGVALSKISLVISIVLLLMIFGRFKPLLIATIVQALTLVVLSIWTSTSPFTTLGAHLEIFRAVAAFQGIHLSFALPWATPLIAIGTVLLFAALILLAAGKSLQVSSSNEEAQAQLAELPLLLFSVLALWSLLVAYHGPYDAVLLLPIYLYIIDRLQRQSWQLPQFWKHAPHIIIGGGLFIMLLPGNIDFADLLSTPEWWPLFLPKLISIHMLMLLLVFLHQLRRQVNFHPNLMTILFDRS